MTRKQKLAVCNKAINHWVDNLFLAHAGELTHDDMGAGHCPFCALYLWESECEGCPLDSPYHLGECGTGRWSRCFDHRDVPTTEAMLIEVERACDAWMKEDR